MPDPAMIYFIIMFIWCCVGFVVGYMIDDDFSDNAFLGAWSGLLWPFSLVVLVLIGICKLIFHIMDRD